MEKQVRHRNPSTVDERNAIVDAWDAAWEPDGPAAYTTVPSHTFTSDVGQFVRRSGGFGHARKRTRTEDAKRDTPFDMGCTVRAPFVDDMVELAKKFHGQYAPDDRLLRFREMWNAAAFSDMQVGWATGPPYRMHAKKTEFYGGDRHREELPTPLQYHVTTHHPSRPPYPVYLQWLYQSAVGLFIDPPRVPGAAPRAGDDAANEDPLETPFLRGFTKGAEGVPDYPVVVGVLLLQHLWATQLNLKDIERKTLFGSALEHKRGRTRGDGHESHDDSDDEGPDSDALFIEKYPVPVRLTAAQLRRIRSVAARDTLVRDVVRGMIAENAIAPTATATPCPPPVLGHILLIHNNAAEYLETRVIPSVPRKAVGPRSGFAEWSKDIKGIRKQLNAYITDGPEAHPRYAAEVGFRADTFAFTLGGDDGSKDD